jgi:hypothetical protein
MYILKILLTLLYKYIYRSLILTCIHPQHEPPQLEEETAEFKSVDHSHSLIIDGDTFKCHAVVTDRFALFVGVDDSDFILFVIS